MIVLDNTILNVALPTLQQHFDASSSTLQWIVDAYLLSFAGLLLTMGTLGDRWQDLAGTVVLKAEDLGPFVALHPQFHAEQYVCPRCAASLWVEIVPAGGPAWTDFTV